MTRLRRLNRDERGFTLTELLVVIVFLGMIGAAFATLFGSVVRHEGDIREQSLTHDEMRGAVDRLIRDIRTAYSPTGWPIESISGAQLTFTVADRSTTPVLRRVSYRVTGGRLERASDLASAGAPTNWRRIVSNVTSATPFSYADSNDVTTTLPAQVRTVSVTMTFSTPTGNGRTYTYTSSASPRISP